MSDSTNPVRKGSLPRHTRVFLIIIAGTLLGMGPRAYADKSPFDWAFINLDYARKEKAEQLRRLCERLRDLAAQARQDKVIVKFFDLNREYLPISSRGDAPEEIKKRIGELRKALDSYYVEHYLAFYDILFVDAGGNVFYTIRKESDFGKNLFDQANADSPLARCLKSDPQQETFIDFHHYGASNEPAAFFIEPVFHEGARVGWLALQCAVNKINSLFAGDEAMGETSEVFVVNRDGYMLTESQFEGDSTILRKHLDDRNIQAKFAAGQGHLKVRDYRGLAAITSFEVFDFLGVKWLVVAKMDEAQVTTDHFRLHRRHYAEIIRRYLEAQPVAAHRPAVRPQNRKTLRVDIDEFLKANHGELLQTPGVATCTGLIAGYPGRFGYLAHISPLDRVYGGTATNLIGQIVKKIKTYDIYSSETRGVRFVIVAPHFDSLPRIVERLVDEGFFLSQISVLYHPQAERAGISYDYSQNRILVEWSIGDDPSQKCIHHADDASQLDDIVQAAIRADEDRCEASGTRPAP